jgi:hypothetical protein
MREPSQLFQLTIQYIDPICTVQLTWGTGQRRYVQLPFPADLLRLYRDWQRAYLNFYRSLPSTAPPTLAETPPPDALRGRLISNGAGTSLSTDWQADLADVQQRLQLELHRWLQSHDLQPIRQDLINAAHQAARHQSRVDVLIACHPLDLARLPWETWELGAEVGLGEYLHLARAPITIQAPAAIAPKRRRPRLLVILGDDRGLNFQREKAATAALSRVAEVVFMGWEPGKTVAQVKDEIQTALVDPQGWDALFFAGHSNEKPSMGGELGIAPQGYVRMAEMAAPLAIALQHGLQFALFNSCNGLNLAESLIDLGLSQVVIMREPIHNAVAETFFVYFAQALAEHKDVQDCLQDACHALKTQKALTYPAADLVPSLFRYPQTTLFRIPRTGWRDRLRRLRPSRWEAIALLGLLLLTWQLPVQKWLIERRVLAQAIYQDLPIHPPPPPPPTLLLQIDEAALREQKRFRPLPRDYLAELIDAIAGTPVVGIDYLLDLPDEDDPRLAQALAEAHRQGSYFVLGASREQNTRQWRYAQDRLRHPSWSTSGSMATRGTLYAELLSQEPWPIAYLLAQLHYHCGGDPCVPVPTDTYPSPSPRFRAGILTRLSYRLGQMWLHPIIDYSLPPHRVYDTLSSQRVSEAPQRLQPGPTVLFIVPNYAAAGIERENDDNFPAPAAYRYWRRGTRRILTGGEYHAYLLYQYLNHRMVVPIPDVWTILPALILAKVICPWLPARQRQRLLILSGGTLLYGLSSLVIYASPWAIALPILTPTVVVMITALPSSKTN